MIYTTVPAMYKGTLSYILITRNINVDIIHYISITIVLHIRQSDYMTSLCSAGSGVEILVNEPYTDGPGAGGSNSGQFTHKVRIIVL